MAADWTWEPHKVYDIERKGSKTLKTTLEDQSQNVRVKSTTIKRIFTERYKQNEADTKSMLEFAKGVSGKFLHLSFVKITYDPEATNPGTEEATVRFLLIPKTREGAGDSVETVWKFREV
jgi:hypothetical protein